MLTFLYNLTLATCCKKLLITQVTNFPFHQAHVQNNVPNPFNNKNIKKKKKKACTTQHILFQSPSSRALYLVVNLSLRSTNQLTHAFLIRYTFWEPHQLLPPPNQRLLVTDCMPTSSVSARILFICATTVALFSATSATDDDSMALPKFLMKFLLLCSSVDGRRV